MAEPLLADDYLQQAGPSRFNAAIGPHTELAQGLDGSQLVDHYGAPVEPEPVVESDIVERPGPARNVRVCPHSHCGHDSNSALDKCGTACPVCVSADRVSLCKLHR